MGLAIGNFATNPIYRLPRGESLFARDPYCGDCNARLLPRDLFPVFSWLSTGGKCRYCGAAVPGAYTVTEALIGALFVAFYLKMGWSEKFILCSFGLTAFVMIAMMLYIDNFFSDRTLVAALTLGMLYRTLQDGSIYGFAGTAYAGLMAGALAWKLSGRPMVRDAAAFPPYLKLLVLAGIWLNWMQLAILLVVAGAGSLLSKRRKWLAEYVIIVLASAAVFFA